MNFLILIAFATSAVFAVSGYEYKSLKSDRWDKPNPSSDPIEGQNQFYEGVFRARLDHFRPQNQERVEFIYHVNANHYNPEGGPLYVYLKDYRDFSTRWIEEGLMVDIARQTGAAVLTFDYRYFGANRPTDTASFEDLEFLSVEQILADVADFSRFIRQYIGNGRYAMSQFSGRQFYYLQCTQMGSFLLADTNTWLPGVVTMDYHMEKCADVFGTDISLENLRGAFNTLMQEYNQAVTNVVYTNGYFDPFRYFGRLYDTTGAGTVVNMDFASKSADLHSLSPNDPESIYVAKERIIELVLRWSDLSQPPPPPPPPSASAPVA